jgi:hypothetical protein
MNTVFSAFSVFMFYRRFFYFLHLLLCCCLYVVSFLCYSFSFLSHSLSVFTFNKVNTRTRTGIRVDVKRYIHEKKSQKNIICLLFLHVSLLFILSSTSSSSSSTLLFNFVYENFFLMSKD